MKNSKFAMLLFSSLFLLCSCTTSGTPVPTNMPVSTVSPSISNISTSSVSTSPTANFSLPSDALAKSPVDFSLKDINGNTISSSSYNGKATVINLFATWCTYCEQEMPFFSKLETEYGDKINIVYIDSSDDASTAELKAFLKKYNISSKNVLIDSSSSVLHKYGYTGLPATIVIDSSGTVRKMQLGAFTTYQKLKDFVVKYGQVK